jgi:hypothetical protein
MAKTNWDPYNGQMPTPPPLKSAVNQHKKPEVFLPPPRRTSSAASQSLSSSSASSAPPLPSRGHSGPPPPPPPRGTTVPPAPPTIRSSPQLNPTPIGPPPIVRSTRPDFQARPKIPNLPTSSDTEIDWSNLSPEDKTVFFNWLDEFFGNFSPPRVTRDAALAHRPAIANASHGPPQQSSVSTLSACHSSHAS